MLDSFFKSTFSPLAHKGADRVSQSGLTATKLVLLAFAFGITGCFVAALQLFPLAIVFILLNRIVAGIAVIVDKKTENNHLASYLAPLCDYVFFAAFAFFFILAVPEHSMAAVFLVLSYLVMGMVYLSQIIVYDRMATLDDPRSGLIETTEITIFMIICCLYPPGFSAFAAMFAFLCWASAVWRIKTSIKTLRS